jgi:hypothetical protein
MDLAGDAGVLDLAADTAQTIQAGDTLEKMLAHQLAAAHALAMKLAGRAMAHTNSAAHDRFGPVRREYHAVEAARAANAAARMMTVFQEGLTSLTKLRSGGAQRVVVQHVTVGGGGQAIVAGQVSAGTRPRGDADK